MSLNKVCVATVLAVFFSAAVVRADAGPSREACIAASESAEPLRKAGKLLTARKNLLVCIAQECPKVLRDDCTEQLVALENALPSIVFSAKGPSGEDLAAVRVAMDGAPLLPRLDGSAVPVDPGEHTFVFEAEGFPTVTKKLVIAQGAKNRSETVAIGEKPRDAANARLVVAANANATVRIDNAIVSNGTWDGHVTPGSHDVRVTQQGMTAAHQTVVLKDGETKTVAITLEPEKRSSAVTWVIIGGAVVLAAGAAVGSYFLFRPEDTQGPPLTGKAGGVSLAVFR